MSSKSATKSSKDRNSRRKQDGTPNRSTPSQEQDERLTPLRNVIWNEEIEKLQIKLEELPKLWPPRPPTPETTFVKVPVKKKHKNTDLGRPKTKIITIAKPASPNAPLQPINYSDFAGIRFDDQGKVIPHSILGNYEEFYKEASRRGIWPENVPPPKGNLEREESLSLKYEKTRKHRSKISADTKSLINWYNRMVERKHQQGFISNLLQKDAENLVMNQSDTYRDVQEQRYLIDRTIAKVDRGKGYRIGSEFWYQQEQLGDEVKGLHVTLSQIQRGYPPPIEHLGLSTIIKKEKGCEWIGQQHLSSNYPWHKSDYLHKRVRQLQPFIQEIDPWKPEFEDLQIVGSEIQSNRLPTNENKGRQSPDEAVILSLKENKFERSREETLGDFLQTGSIDSQTHKLPEQPTEVNKNTKQPVFGPSLLVAGHSARWQRDTAVATTDTIGLEAIVDFETFAGDQLTTSLEVVNNGTTCIFYDWKKLSKVNPFGFTQNQPVQRFYFDTNSGAILPGDIFKVPITFKSANAGLFTEQWKLETRPVLCGDAALVITLRAVALQVDKFKENRETLEADLHHRQAIEIASSLVQDLVSAVRTPPRSVSPIDAYITEEEIFLRNNPGVQYNHELVTQLKDIYKQLFDTEVQAESVWSLSIEDLEASILQLDEEQDGQKEMLLNQMNSIIGQLTYLPHKPAQADLKMMIGHQIVAEAIDKMVEQSILLRSHMKLPNKGHDGSIQEAELKMQSPKTAEVKNNIDTAKDKVRDASRDVKTNRSTAAKSETKTKTPSLSSSRKSSAPSKSPVVTPAPTSDQGEKTEGQGAELASNQTTQDKEELSSVEQLYRETFTVQVYDLLGDIADRMEVIFSALEDNTNIFPGFSLLKPNF